MVLADPGGWSASSRLVGSGDQLTNVTGGTGSWIVFL